MYMLAAMCKLPYARGWVHALCSRCHASSVAGRISEELQEISKRDFVAGSRR